MNILYINHYAGGPAYGMEFRPYYLSKIWVSLGHNVTIVSSSFSHLRTHQPNVKNDLQEENIDGIKYLWIKTNKYNSSNIKRVINILAFVIKLYYNIKRISRISRPDLVLASSTYPFDIYPAYKISKLCRAKLVFELHDMWPLSPMIIGGYSRWHPYIRLIQRAEDFACKKSAGYISLLGNAEEYLIEHGLEKGKFTHIPNGYYIDDWREENRSRLPEEHLRILKNLKLKEKIIIGYTGGHAPSNSLNTLIEVAKKMQDLCFVLVGNGVSKNELIKITKVNKIKNVFFLPAVKKEIIPTLLNFFDIGYIGGVKSILHYYGTASNKIIDYMLAGLPILYAVDEPNSMISRIGCGIQTPAENTEEIIDALYKIVNLSANVREQMGAKGRDYAVNNLNYKILAEKAIHAFEKY